MTDTPGLKVSVVRGRVIEELRVGKDDEVLDVRLEYNQVVFSMSEAHELHRALNTLFGTTRPEAGAAKPNP